MPSHRAEITLSNLIRPLRFNFVEVFEHVFLRRLDSAVQARFYKSGMVSKHRKPDPGAGAQARAPGNDIRELLTILYP